MIFWKEVYYVWCSHSDFSIGNNIFQNEFLYLILTRPKLSVCRIAFDESSCRPWAFLTKIIYSILCLDHFSRQLNYTTSDRRSMTRIYLMTGDTRHLSAFRQAGNYANGLRLHWACSFNLEAVFLNGEKSIPLVFLAKAH